MYEVSELLFRNQRLSLAGCSELHPMELYLLMLGPSEGLSLQSDYQDESNCKVRASLGMGQGAAKCVRGCGILNCQPPAMVLIFEHHSHVQETATQPRR